jgi:prepilin-type N-terminal cleavage/methylation domain-containing protein
MKNTKIKTGKRKTNKGIFSIFNIPFFLQPRGFSLIELLVSISIFVIISTVVLANHSRFNSSVLLGSLAYDMALSIREAQVFGVSVRQYDSEFEIGYGIHFSGSSSYLFFVDTNANRQYDQATDSIVRSYSLGRGHYVSQFCGTTTSGTERCSDSATPISDLDIVFYRPDPDAIISSNEPGFYSSGRITVMSPGGSSRSVNVASTGQISVESL